MSNALWPHGVYVAHQAPLSMEFSRQEYWNGLPFLSPGNLPNPGVAPMSLGYSFPSEPPGKDQYMIQQFHFQVYIWSKWDFSSGTSGKEPACQCRKHRIWVCKEQTWLKNLACMHALQQIKSLSLRDIQTSIFHSSIIHRSQNMEAAQQMDKENMREKEIDNGIPFNHKN